MHNGGMDISLYLRRVQEGVASAAALADDDTKQIVSRLGTSVESVVQLTLIEALADAAAEISAELAPGSVGMTMHGLTPRFTVSAPPSTGEPTYLAPDDAESEDEDPADDTMVRFSLRLPQWAKDKADQRAADEGVSTNTWLAERVIRELSSRGRPGRPPWAGADQPDIGAVIDAAGQALRDWTGGKGRGRSGNVQGWV